MFLLANQVGRAKIYLIHIFWLWYIESNPLCNGTPCTYMQMYRYQVQIKSDADSFLKNSCLNHNLMIMGVPESLATERRRGFLVSIQFSFMNHYIAGELLATFRLIKALCNVLYSSKLGRYLSRQYLFSSICNTAFNLHIHMHVCTSTYLCTAHNPLTSHYVCLFERYSKTYLGKCYLVTYSC